MTTAAMVRHVKFFRAAICVLFKDSWIWWLVLVAEDSVDDYPLGKSPFLGAASFRQQDTRMNSPPFSYCLRSFIADKSFYLHFASYRRVVTSRSIVAVVLTTRHPRIAELHFLLPLPR